MDTFVLDINDAIAQRTPAAHVACLRALDRVIAVAYGDSLHKQTCGRFLLAFYDCPFCIGELRGLPDDLHEDCLSVLRLDKLTPLELHSCIEEGADVFVGLYARWSDARG